MKNVRDVMTSPVFSVRGHTPLKDVAFLLIDHGISGVPVVDADGKLLGVISEADFLMKEQGAEAIRHRRLARFIGESRESRSRQEKVAAVTAAEAMTAPAVTIDPRARISEAAALMTDRRVNRLPVVEHEALVGIVTRADLVRAYVRSDDELAATIRDEVLLHVLWLDPASFDLSVKNGVATIRGHVERRSTAEMMDHLIAMVPGIIGVQVDVNWAVDDSRAEPVSLDPVFPFGPR
jgi:CBS domain-containing protein